MILCTHDISMNKTFLLLTEEEYQFCQGEVISLRPHSVEVQEDDKTKKQTNT